MMRSLFAGVSGLKNHQTRMDVIGNNIANVNTVGFKASRVNFQDVLSQTLQGASAGSGTRGGTNPIQIGLGSGLASVDTIFTDGSFQPTGKQTDLAIQGQGFFVLSDGASQLYTRAGAFDFDTSGNFLVPGTGYMVMGWKADSSGNINTNGVVDAIKIPVGTTMPAQASTEITYANNLSADKGTTANATIPVYDALGKAHKINAVFTKIGDNTWTFDITDRKTDTSFDITGSPLPMTLKFDSSTGKLNPAASTLGDFSFTPAGCPTVTIKPNFADITQFGGESTVQATEADGYAAGDLLSTNIDPSGIIVGRFTNGKTQNLAQIALATFNNPGGLNKVGDNLFSVSSNSGQAQVGPSGSGGRGKFNPGTLEMSNVDLANEFSNMIITQRGFQANSKVITATDEMLQELANLKR